MNKWDGLDSYARERVKHELVRKLQFLDFANQHFISAINGQGVDALMKSVGDAYAAATTKLSTPKITRVLLDAVARQQPHRRGVSRPKMRYAH